MNTAYFANQRHQSAMQTFSGPGRTMCHHPVALAAFLRKCHIAKMICRHTVLHQSDGI